MRSFFLFFFFIFVLDDLISFLLELSICAHVKLILYLVADSCEFIFLEKREQIPGNIERLKNCSVVIQTLIDKLSFESVVKLKIESIFIRQCFLSYDCLHRLSVFS